MSKIGVVVLALALTAVSAFAVDGVTLINQATVIAAGGFPYVISQPGSYKLSGNLVGTFGVDVIQITGPKVTLDLNGFVIGSAGAATSDKALIQVAAVKGTTVRNGTLSSVLVPIFSIGTGSVFEDLTLIQENGGGNATLGSAIVRRVTYPGAAISVTCPALVVDSMTSLFIRAGTFSSCTFGFISGGLL